MIARTVFSMLALLCGGCANQVKYAPFTSMKFDSTGGATVLVSPNWKEAKELQDKSKLPHLSIRDQHRLMRESGKILRTPLGSDDYLLIGEIGGGGNAQSNPQLLRQAIAEKAANVGGNAVLLLDEGVSEQPYTVVMPGQSQTTAYANAYSVGRNAYGYGRANTTHSPGYAFSGVNYLPHANGLVFRHVAGLADFWSKIDKLPDDALKQIIEKWQASKDDTRPFSIVFSEMQRDVERSTR